jgi:hypothetical protein
MARTPKNVQANPHVTSPAVVDPSAGLVTEPSGQSAAALPDPVDAPLEGEEQKLAEDAADAAGIGSAHGDEPTHAIATLVEEVHEAELHPDPELAGLMAREIELRAKLSQLGDPLARRRELDAAIEAEIASFKAAQKAHAERLGRLRQAKNDEFEPGQNALEAIEHINTELASIDAKGQARAALLAAQAAVAHVVTGTTAALAGDSA